MPAKSKYPIVVRVSIARGEGTPAQKTAFRKFWRELLAQAKSEAKRE